MSANPTNQTPTFFVVDIYDLSDAIEAAAAELEDDTLDATDASDASVAPDAPDAPDAKPAGVDWRDWYDALAWIRGALERDGAKALVHCGDLVLHRRGECRYCDEHGAQAQRARMELEIPFSGELGAPDSLFRPDDAIRRWSGNRPYRKGDVASHLGFPFVVE